MASAQFNRLKARGKQGDYYIWKDKIGSQMVTFKYTGNRIITTSWSNFVNKYRPTVDRLRKQQVKQPAPTTQRPTPTPKPAPSTGKVTVPKTKQPPVDVISEKIETVGNTKVVINKGAIITEYFPSKGLAKGLKTKEGVPTGQYYNLSSVEKQLKEQGVKYTRHRGRNNEFIEYTIPSKVLIQQVRNKLTLDQKVSKSLSDSKTFAGGLPFTPVKPKDDEITSFVKKTIVSPVTSFVKGSDVFIKKQTGISISKGIGETYSSIDKHFESLKGRLRPKIKTTGIYDPLTKTTKSIITKDKPKTYFKMTAKERQEKKIESLKVPLLLGASIAEGLVKSPVTIPEFAYTKAKVVGKSLVGAGAVVGSGIGATITGTTPRYTAAGSVLMLQAGKEVTDFLGSAATALVERPVESIGFTIGTGVGAKVIGTKISKTGRKVVKGYNVDKFKQFVGYKIEGIGGKTTTYIKPIGKQVTQFIKGKTKPKLDKPTAAIIKQQSFTLYEGAPIAKASYTISADIFKISDNVKLGVPKRITKLYGDIKGRFLGISSKRIRNPRVPKPKGMGGIVLPGKTGYKITLTDTGITSTRYTIPKIIRPKEIPFKAIRVRTGTSIGVAGIISRKIFKPKRRFTYTYTDPYTGAKIKRVLAPVSSTAKQNLYEMVSPRVGKDFIPGKTAPIDSSFFYEVRAYSNKLKGGVPNIELPAIRGSKFDIFPIASQKPGFKLVKAAKITKTPLSKTFPKPKDVNVKDVSKALSSGRGGSPKLDLIVKPEPPKTSIKPKYIPVKATKVYGTQYISVGKAPEFLGAGAAATGIGNFLNTGSTSKFISTPILTQRPSTISKRISASYPKLSPDVKSFMGSSSILTSRTTPKTTPRLTPRTIPITIPKTTPITIPRTTPKVTQRLTQKLTPKLTPRPTPIITTFFDPRVGITPTKYNKKYESIYGRRIKLPKKTRRRVKYVPSLTAAFFGITRKKVPSIKARKRFTGREIRPVVINKKRRKAVNLFLGTKRKKRKKLKFRMF